MGDLLNLSEELHIRATSVVKVTVSVALSVIGGTDRLRKACGVWHGAEGDNVLVTVGAAEANSIAVSCILAEGTLPTGPLFNQLIKRF